MFLDRRLSKSLQACILLGAVSAATLHCSSDDGEPSGTGGKGGGSGGKASGGTAGKGLSLIHI